MSILIKGTQMPKNCNKCPLHFYEGQGTCSCRVLSAIDDDEILKPWKNKRKDCPLVPVPPHGRLIDADALIEWLYSDEPNALKAPFRLCTADRSDVIFLVKNAPTIIPAEEGER